ncbi:hypothetical protein [Rhodoferax ferrireducens]|uniref:hypothetical protein n=1 Tax=Rhodoferax ferrireducens TaxID=192843 RepID=UPI001300565B|nr:hypothetical protein [Rhodoferax ferrireducens]
MKYIKTEKGRAEIAGRSGSLSALQRRVLIVVDGKKTVNDLGAFVRVGELDSVLDHLLRAGLIAFTDDITLLQQPAAPGFAAAEATDLPRPATSPQEFEKVRQQASDFVLDKLGASGAPICDAINRCDSPAELRKLLRGVEIFIGQRMSAETTQAFARHFGSLLL